VQSKKVQADARASIFAGVVVADGFSIFWQSQCLGMFCKWRETTKQMLAIRNLCCTNIPL
jgi:hypothetical protein